MWRTFPLFMLLFVAFVAASPEQPNKRKIACKIPENAKNCYWTHGRLSIYNGNPTFRLWKIGTHRLLGIYSGPGFGPFDAGLNEEDDLELPTNLKGYNFTKATVFGDFEVCPLAAEKEGRMQPACIESAKNLVSEKSNL
ncbi:MAG TPA: hypothetical protein VFO39_08405 [Candidatus Sulfotelmatobacter sp.]|nr:hypothetical protein [Candidatus Sulfotelmatobacter sp.]